MKPRFNGRKGVETIDRRKPDLRLLDNELSRLQELSQMGFEVKVKWLLGKAKRHDGKLLAEEVIGDTIVIYAKDLEEALHLVAHGFSEWLLNIHARPYRNMINKLIELFEQQQYQKKERLVAALERLFENTHVRCACSEDR